jgi:hypothetical protein
MQGPADDGVIWRRDLRRKVVLALVAKLAGLFALWYFFFRGPPS